MMPLSFLKTAPWVSMSSRNSMGVPTEMTTTALVGLPTLVRMSNGSIRSVRQLPFTAALAKPNTGKDMNVIREQFIQAQTVAGVTVLSGALSEMQSAEQLLNLMYAIFAAFINYSDFKSSPLWRWWPLFSV
jgi:hypothetical protein